MSLRGSVPVLVVSGFLGSGKTTLVRRLLANAQATGVRVAVVSNEFGELGIDAALLGTLDEDYVELRGGCVCCKLSDQLVDTLQMLRDITGLRLCYALGIWKVESRTPGLGFRV